MISHHPGNPNNGASADAIRLLATAHTIDATVIDIAAMLYLCLCRRTCRRIREGRFVVAMIGMSFSGATMIKSQE